MAIMGHKTLHRFENDMKIVQWKTFCVELINLPYGILLPALLSMVVTEAVDGNVRNVICFGLLILAIVLGYMIINSMLRRKLQKNTLDAVHKCKEKMYHIFLANPMNILYHSGLGENLETFNDDFNTLMKRFTESRPVFGAALIEIISFSMYLSLKSPMLAGIIFAIALLQIIPPLLVKKYMQLSYDDCRDIEGEITEFTVTAFRGFITIKMYQLENWWLDQLEELHKRYKKIGRKSVYVNQTESVLNSFMDSILKYGTYCIIGLFVLLQNVSFEMGIQAIVLSGNIYAAVKRCFSVLPQFAIADTAESRINNWYIDREKGEAIGLEKNIELKNIALSHDKKLLENVSVNLDMAKINVIKGSNGVGKSTIFKLLVGMEAADEGEVYIGGVPVQKINSGAFPYNIFYLMQEDPLFDLTPQELYTCVADEGDRKEKNLFAKSYANAKRFELTDDLLRNDVISKLSGGERKKVFLALAFGVNPEYLFLDEPTNNLDEMGKKVLLEMLVERNGGAIIVTHERMFDKIAECIWILQEGKLKYEK